MNQQSGTTPKSVKDMGKVTVKMTLAFINQTYYPSLVEMAKVEIAKAPDQERNTLAYAVYKNTRAAKKILEQWRMHMDGVLRSFTEHDGNGNVVYESDPKSGGMQLPKYRSEQDRQAYLRKFHEVQMKEVEVPVHQVDEQLIELIPMVEGRILHGLSAMFVDLSGEEDHDLDLGDKEESVPSGPKTLDNGTDERTAAGGNDRERMDNEPQEGPSPSAVLEQQSADQ